MYMLPTRMSPKPRPFDLLDMTGLCPFFKCMLLNNKDLVWYLIFGVFIHVSSGLNSSSCYLSYVKLDLMEFKHFNELMLHPGKCSLLLFNLSYF